MPKDKRNPDNGGIIYAPLNQVKSPWYTDILNQWSPDLGYIEYIKKQIRDKSYLPPIVVVRQEGHYCIVNGHHRYYAHLSLGEETIKCIVISGTFEESEPLRKAEALLKEFDQKTDYVFQLSGYLDRWAAEAENCHFINKHRPSLIYKFFKNIKKLKEKLSR